MGFSGCARKSAIALVREISKCTLKAWIAFEVFESCAELQASSKKQVHGQFSMDFSLSFDWRRIYNLESIFFEPTRNHTSNTSENQNKHKKNIGRGDVYLGRDSSGGFLCVGCRSYITSGRELAQTWKSCVYSLLHGRVRVYQEEQVARSLVEVNSGQLPVCDHVKIYWLIYPHWRHSIGLDSQIFGNSFLFTWIL